MLVKKIPSTQIGKEYKCSYMVILRVLRENNVQVRDNRINRLNIEKDILPLFNKGISLTKIARQFNTDRHVLSEKLKSLGIDVINHQNESKFNEHIFDVIDTEEKAYWLGFIYADGYISSSTDEYTFELSLKESDKQHLYKFNRFMQHIKDNVKVSKSICNNKIFGRCRWSVANKHLWNTLNNYGCTPNKSLILQFPKFSIFKSKKLIKHFIRGYVDGDGCISYVKTDDSKINSNYSPQVSILGTKEFLGTLVKLFNCGHIKTTKSNCFNLVFSQNKSRKLLHLLYDNASIYLNRKYNRAMFFENACRSAKELAELLKSENGKDCDVNTVLS